MSLVNGLAALNIAVLLLLDSVTISPVAYVRLAPIVAPEVAVIRLFPEKVPLSVVYEIAPALLVVVAASPEVPVTRPLAKVVACVIVSSYRDLG